MVSLVEVVYVKYLWYLDFDKRLLPEILILQGQPQIVHSGHFENFI